MFDPTRTDEAVEAYEAGDSLDVLAARYDCSPATMRAELLRAGVTLRPPGRRPRSGPGHVKVSGLVPTYGYGPDL